MSDSCKMKSRVVIRYEFTRCHSLVQYLIDIPLGMAAAGPPAKHYQSAFKAPQLRSEFLSAPALTFDSYQFMQTFCTVNGEGGIMLIEKSESETILVAKGWQKFAWVASQLKLVFQLNIISLRDIQSLLSESVQ